MNDKIDKAAKILEEYNQQQIIPYLAKSDKLAEQVLKIDFKEIQELYNKTFEDIYVDLEDLQPIKSTNPSKISKEELDELKNIGESIIKNKKLAVATMAGGQGTRLRTFRTQRYI